MKNRNFSVAILTISASILITLLLFSIGAGAEETVKNPKIISQNIEYSKEFKIMYAVDADTVAEGAVNLYLYDTEPTDKTVPIRIYKEEEPSPASENGNLKRDAYIFITEGISYADMDKNFYVRAVDSKGNKSEVKRYSVAEYFYERLSDKTITDDQKKFYRDTIEFGEGIQKNVLKITDKSKLITSLRYVVADGGTTDGKYDAGLYFTGTTLTPEFSGNGDFIWNVITYDQNGEQIDDVPNVTSYNIPETEGISKILFKAKKAIYYREGTNTLDEGTNLASVNIEKKFESSWGDLIEETGRGKLASFSLNKNGYAGLYHNNTLVDQSQAMAFEASFDIKATTSGTYLSNGAVNEFYELRIMNGETQYHSIKIYTYRNGSDEDLFMCDTSKETDYHKTFDGIKATDWLHIRVVIYNDNSGLYVYINGGEEPFISSNPLNGFAGDIKQIEAVRLFASGDGGASSTGGDTPLKIKIDNVFCGYIKDNVANQ